MRCYYLPFGCSLKSLPTAQNQVPVRGDKRLPRVAKEYSGEHHPSNRGGLGESVPPFRARPGCIFRREQLPRSTPRDTDGDGRDDVSELVEGTNPPVLDEAPLALTQFPSSPLEGEGGVAVTRETGVRFNRSLSAVAQSGARAS